MSKGHVVRLSAVMAREDPSGKPLFKALDSPTAPSAKQLADVLASNSATRVTISPCTAIKDDEIRFIIADR